MILLDFAYGILVQSHLACSVFPHIIKLVAHMGKSMSDAELPFLQARFRVLQYILNGAFRELPMRYQPPRKLHTSIL